MFPACWGSPLESQDLPNSVPQDKAPTCIDSPGNILRSSPGYMPRFPVASPEEILHFVLSLCESSVYLA